MITKDSGNSQGSSSTAVEGPYSKAAPAPKTKHLAASMTAECRSRPPACASSRTASSGWKPPAGSRNSPRASLAAVRASRTARGRPQGVSFIGWFVVVDRGGPWWSF